MKLTLESGPKLLLSGDAPGVQGDVAAHAVEYLFDNICLGPDICLADLLALFDLCPALRSVFKRWFAEELCARARLGPLTNNGDLLHIEVRPAWELNSHLHEYAGVSVLNVHGVGPVPENAEDSVCVSDDGFVRYSLADLDVRTLLTVPVLYNNAVDVWEQDTHSINRSRVIQRHTCNDIQLGAVLNAIVYELTWFGVVGSDDEETGDASDEEPDAPLTDPVPDPRWTQYLSDLTSGCYGWLDPRAWDQFFVSMGSLSKRELASALQRIPDGCNAAHWLARNVGREVVVRKYYRQLGGRDFRAAFSQAHHASETADPLR